MGTDAVREDAERRKEEGKNKGVCFFFHTNSLLSEGWEGRYYRPPFALVISIHKLMIQFCGLLANSLVVNHRS